jgi:hypothetical protein
MRRLVPLLAIVAASAWLTPVPAQDRAAIGRRLEQARALAGLERLPGAESVTVGNRTIPAGTTVTGPVVVSEGGLEVLGEIDGDAVVLDGDLYVRRGGLVRGQAVALGGVVTLDGGRVDGEIRSLQSAADIAAAAAERVQRTRWQKGMVLAASLLLLLLLGIATTLMAQPALDGVATELERDFGRALLVGFLAELALAPVLGLAVVGLALTIVGLLLVPFAIVAYALAVAGLVSLGILGMARLVGGVLSGDSGRRLSASGASLRAVVLGAIVLMVPWGATLAVGAVWPTGEWLLGIAAAGISWVAATAGFGATLLSRVGMRPVRASASREIPVDQYAWATPTPVTGVAAARRPVATSGAGR